MSAIGSAPRPTASRSRRTLLSGGAVAAALVVTGHAVPVRAADGYNATISLPNSVNYSGATGANQAQVQLTNPNSVITWQPTQVGGTSVNFQDTGGTTTFVGPRGASDFIVLNRLPATETRSITLNGTTNGVLFGGTTPAGTIWFDSPGGIFVSGSATFNVGSLLLSTNAIGYNAASGYGAVDPNSIVFGGPAGSQSTIRIASGAQLLASGAGSFGSNYIALVAPRIDQGGLVSAAQAAYVAAESGDMTINSGLFSIAITNGTTATFSEGLGRDGIAGTADDLTGNDGVAGTADDNLGADGVAGTADDVIQNVALRHTGTTRLNAAKGQTNRAFMVAVPKNNAITMLVGGAVSYAATASVVDGAVVLSTGNISDGLTPQTENANPGATVAGSTDIVFGDGGSFTSVYAASRNNVRTRGGLTVAGDVSLFGSDSVAFGATGALNPVSVNRRGEGGGNIALTSYRTDSVGNRTGGTASLFALDDALVSVAGGVTVDSSGAAQPRFVPLVVVGPTQAEGNGQGGTATLTIAGSRMTIGDSLSLLANGTGVDGGVGIGGTAAIDTTNGSLLVGNNGAVGDLMLSAFGQGGDANDGGAGQGGTAGITARGTYVGGLSNSVRVIGTATLDASGVGGGALNGTGGSGIGGSAVIDLSAATGSDGVVRAASLTPATTLALLAGGIGGQQVIESFGNASGGAGRGGIASIEMSGSVLASSGEALAVRLDASGTGGDATDTFDDLLPGTGGVGAGGVARFVAVDGVSDLDRLSVFAAGSGGRGASSFGSGESGYGSAGGAGGAASGGRAVLSLSDQHILFLANSPAEGVTAALSISASATGGAGGDSLTLAGGAGGAGLGGVESGTIGTGTLAGVGGAYVSLTDATVQPNRSTTARDISLIVEASGTGGTGGVGVTDYGTGGAGGGGRASLVVVDTGGFRGETGSFVTVSATGTGGGSGSDPSEGSDNSDSFGTGGSGTGGGALTPAGIVTAGGATVSVRGVTGNSLGIIADSLSIDASGTGGGGNLRGGAARGGTAGLALDNASIDNAGEGDTVLTLAADATGGSRVNGAGSSLADAAGGDAAGGRASIAIANGPTSFLNPVTISADATGGERLDLFGPDYAGGAATGGSASLNVTVGGSVAFDGGLTLNARGIGGGGNYRPGGAATGGSATVVTTGGDITAAGLTLAATASGGRSRGDDVNPHDGGAATGGLASLSITRAATGPAGTITVTSTTLLDAGAAGGVAEAGYGNTPITTAAGGAAFGGGFASPSVNPTGGVIVDIQTGVASLGVLRLNAAGIGGDTAAGGATGAGLGGLASIGVGTVGQAGGTLTATGITLDAFGEAGEHASAYGNGGAGAIGTGGRALLGLVGGTLTNTGSLTLDASGAGGDGDINQSSSGVGPGGNGGAGIGGSATIDIANAVLTTGTITARADGTGGDGGAGQSGGDGIGGIGRGGGAAAVGTLPASGGTGAGVLVAGTTGRIVLRGNLDMSASGTGGSGGTDSNDSRFGADGALGQGGRVAVSTQTGGTIAPDEEISADISLVTRGLGGNGGGTSAVGSDLLVPRGGVGGGAIGGVTSLSAAAGGGVTAFNATLDGSATGGNGAPDVRGGDATGGRADITAASGTIDLLAIGDVSPLALLDVHAAGGTGGGSATGGGASVIVSGTGRYQDAMRVDISATGAAGANGRFGASATDGGDATAGTFMLDLATGSVEGLSIDAFALGGRGGDSVEEGYGALGGAGGAGGDADGGPINISVGNGATLNFAEAGLAAARTAGNGGNGSRGATGATGARGADGTPTSINGGAGGTGGTGQAGGAGGRGGTATGLALLLTADRGAISFTGREGASIDLTAQAGSGGIGGQGGTGGAGGGGGHPRTSGAGCLFYTSPSPRDIS
ncbi:beta strand repeat-containing protein, partial [Sphingomonas solaris]